MKAMILVAGYGKRMGQLTHSTPKPLIPFHKKPILSYIIHSLPRIDELVLNSHFCHEQIENYFQKKVFPFKTKIYYEPKILGTGRGLLNVSSSLKGTDFILHNCDLILNIDWSSLFSRSEKDFDIALITTPEHCDRGLIFDEKNGLVGHYNSEGSSTNKKSFPIGSRVLNYCGVSYFSKKASNAIFSTNWKYESLIDIFLNCHRLSLKVVAWVLEPKDWLEIGTIEQLNLAEKKFSSFFPHEKKP